MFLIDLSPSMGATRTVEIPEGKGETRSVEMTKLEWSLQFVKMKIQEMVPFFFKGIPRYSSLPRQIFNGRKTDQCGVITFGSEGASMLANAGICASREQIRTISSMTRTGAMTTFQSTFQLANLTAVRLKNWTNSRHQRLRGTVSPLYAALVVRRDVFRN